MSSRSATSRVTFKGNVLGRTFPLAHFLSQSGFSDTLDCLDHAPRGVFGLEIIRGCDSRMQKSRLSENCVPDHVILSYCLVNCHLHSCQHSRT